MRSTKGWIGIVALLAGVCAGCAANKNDQTGARAEASPVARAGAPVFNVRAFGATGGGRQLDTPAINMAIDAANAAGGGTVFFPTGTYL
jgi:polygalacturonase